MSWVIGIGWITVPLSCIGIGYLFGYRDGRDKARAEATTTEGGSDD